MRRFFFLLITGALAGGCDAAADCRGRVAEGPQPMPHVVCGERITACDITVTKAGTLQVDCDPSVVDGKECRLEGYCFTPTSHGIVPAVHWTNRAPNDYQLLRLDDVVRESEPDVARCCFGLKLFFYPPHFGVLKD